MYIDPKVIDDIKGKADIVSLVDNIVPLQPQGKDYMGLCPFHDEKTPSFYVIPSKKSYYCFGCHEGGNVFNFFQTLEGLSFVESVKKVADLIDYPLQVTVDEKQEPKEQTEKEKLIAMHQLALDFFHQMLLHTKEGEEALQYLVQRGFSKEIIQQFKIGVALKDRSMLFSLLKRHGFSQDLMQKSGLVLVYEKTTMDRFYDRIMFPLRNELGQVVGFSGRVYHEESDERLDAKKPKYLNSPETNVFHKGTFLFNLDLAKTIIRKTNQFVLCEGFMDVIAMHQAGIKNAVASMGTSLTTEQISLLKRYGKQVVIAYDGDKAGLNATDRAIDLFKQQGQLTVSVLPMAYGMDPDEMIHEKGVDYFLHHFETSQETVLQFYKRFYDRLYGTNRQHEQLEYIDALLYKVMEEPSAIAQSLFIKELANDLGLQEKQLEEQMRVLKKNKAVNTPLSDIDHLMATPIDSKHLAGNKNAVFTSNNQAEDQLLYRLITNDEAYRMVQEKSEEPFMTVLYQSAYLHYQLFKQTREDTEFVDSLMDTQLRNLVHRVLLLDMQESVTEKEIDDILTTIQRKKWQNILNDKKNRLKMASKEEMISLLQEIQVLQQKILMK